MAKEKKVTQKKDKKEGNIRKKTKIAGKLKLNWAAKVRKWRRGECTLGIAESILD